MASAIRYSVNIVRLAAWGGLSSMPALNLREHSYWQLLVAMRRPARGTRPHAAPAQPSPQLAQSPSPLGHVAFGSKKHPARSSRASLPRFERAPSGENSYRASMRHGGAFGRAGGQGELAGERASGRAGVRAGIAAKAGDMESGRVGARARGRPGGLVGGRDSSGAS